MSLPKFKIPSLSPGTKIIGKSVVKVAGKAFWIITAADVTNKVANYIEHGDTNDLVVGGDIRPKDIADGKIKELLDKTEPGDKTKGSTTQREKDGDYRDAEKDFDDLKLNDVKEIGTQYGIGKVGTLPDGRTVSIRPGSSNENQDSTLQISEKGNPEKTKIRYKGK